MTTRWEVEAAVYASAIDPAGKLVMLALLSKSTASTAEVAVQHAPTFDELASMTGWSRSTIAEWMKVLAATGWARRAAESATAKSGYLLGVGVHEVALPKRASRRKSDQTSPPSGPIVDDPSQRPEQEIEKKIDDLVRRADQVEAPVGPPSGLTLVRSADQISPPSGLRSEPSPITGFLTFTPPPPALRDQASPPHPSAGKWQTADRKPTPADGPPNKAHAPRQPALFAKTQGNLPQATQIVLDGLRAAGHPNATPDDARAVHRAVVTRYGPKVNLNYLRSMAGNHSFGSFLDEIKAGRAEQVEAQIRELQRANPDCEHGTAAGALAHPITGEPLCPWCRSGTARAVEAKERTHPAVAAAVAVYRTTHQGRLGVGDLLRITQEAKVLYDRGCTADQLAEYARTAAQTNTGLLHTAAVK